MHTEHYDPVLRFMPRPYHQYSILKWALLLVSLTNCMAMTMVVAQETVYDGYRGAFYSLAFSPDSSTLAISGNTAEVTEVRLVDVVSRIEKWRFTTRTGGFPFSLAFSHDGRMVGVANGFGAHILDANERRHAFSITPSPGSGVECVAFSPDGTLLVGEGAIAERPRDIEVANLRIWNVKEQKETSKIRAHGISKSASGLVESAVHAMAFGQDGTLITGGTGKVAKVWDTTKWKEVAALTHDADVRFLSLTSDGTRLATATDDGRMYIWDMNARRRLRALDVDEGDTAPQVVWVRPDTIFVSSGGAIQSWSVEEFRRVGRIDADELDYGALSVSPDGKFLAATANAGKDRGAIVIWEVERLIRTMKE